MRHFIVLAMLASALSAAPMPNPQYRKDVEFVRLREGIRGGYAPEPAKFELLALQKKGDKPVLYWRELHGDKGYQVYRRQLDNLDPVLKDLQTLGTFSLPEIGEEESEDIYRQNTALEVYAGGKAWKHSPPQSCMMMQAKVKVDEAQRQLYQQSLERVRKLAQGGSPIAEKEMQEAYGSIFAPQR